MPRRSSPSSLQLLHSTNAAITRAFAPSAIHLQPTSLSLSSSLPPPAASPSSSSVFDADRTPRRATFYRCRCRKEKGVEPEPRSEADPSHESEESEPRAASREPRAEPQAELSRAASRVEPPKSYFSPSTSGHGESSTGSHLSFLEGNRGLTPKFTVPRQVNLEIAFLSSGGSVARGLDRGHNQVSDKGFPTTGPRIEAGNVVIHRGLHVTRPLVVACVPSGVRSCLRIDTDAGCSVRGSLLSGLWSWSLVVEGRLIRASFGSTRLIRASLGITRLIGVSFGITRLIRASFGITRLICAFYGTTRLLCRVRGQRGADRRGARRMREGHMDASGFLYASADVFFFFFVRIFGFVI
ncbi:hypothetical protein E6C27_scaffold376G00450 [Cucumis melo var. makuwa]|uniref:Mucin-19-like n=1 Tax=Cucumis melo var. makuwa TaxID=1194695 RepID=A0A5A7TRI8_CUCMM|nr:hypothetical protein E6C27_scaffold376G00450 [Cucumis melo var. makuwa]